MGTNSLRRVWFKQEMRERILDGRKVATTRNHALPLADVLAVSGSRFNAEPFAILTIQDRIPTNVESVYNLFYREEGFETTQEMKDYAHKEKLLQNVDGQVFYHKFKLKERVKRS